MGSAKKAFSGMVWNLAVNIVTALFGFFATPILIRYFGRADYGLISLATSINGYMALMDMGLTSTNVRFFSNWIANGDFIKVRKLMQTCTAFYGVVGIINAVVLIVISIFSKSIFNVTPEQDVILKEMLWVLCIMALINWYTSCYNQIISATENVAWVQKRTLLTKGLAIIVIAITLIFKLNILQYFIGIMACGLLVLPVTVKKIKKEAPYVKLHAKFDKDVFKEILPYTISIFSFSFFQFSYNQLKVVILGMRGTIDAVTDYGVMNGIASMIGVIGGIFIQSLLPASSRIIAKKDQSSIDFVAYKGTHFITMVLCFCAFGLMSIDRDLMMVYVGKDFMHLIPWLNIWLLITITSNVSCISSLILGGSDVKPLSYSSAVASILAILASWFSIPYFEAGGVIIGMIVYTSVQQLFYYFYYWKKALGINPWRIFIKTDVPFILIGSLIYLFVINVPHFDNHWVNIFAFGALFAIIYLIVCYLFLNKGDKQYLLNLIQRKK